MAHEIVVADYVGNQYRWEKETYGYTKLKNKYITEFNKQISNNNTILDTLRKKTCTVKYFRSHFKLLQCYSVHITVNLNA